jgi:hypothetical protein
MNNAGQQQESPLIIFGGLVAELNPSDLPPGSAAICCDMDFTVGSVKTRYGVENVYVYDGSDETLDAGSGVNVDVDGGAAWEDPTNIELDSPPDYASVTLNAIPVAVSANNQQLVFHANGQSIPLTQIQDNAGNPGVWATLFGTFSQEQVNAATSIVVTGFVNGANNGTFTVLGVATGQITIVCTCVNEVHAATGVTNTGNGPTWTITVTASGSAIEVGDTAFVQINGRDPFGTPSPLTTIASVTDNLGNTWRPVAPIQYTENPVRGLFQMWYAMMGTAVPLSSQLIITVNEDNSGNPVAMTALAFQNFRGVGALISYVQNAGLDSITWASGTLDLSQDAFLLAYAWAHESIGSGPTGYTTPPPGVWGSNGANNSEGQYTQGVPGAVTDAGWTQEAPDAFASTLAAFTVQTTPSSSFSDLLEASGYGFSIPLDSQVLGVELQAKGMQSSQAASSLMTATPIVGGGEPITFQLPASQGTIVLGGPGEFLGMTLTPAIVNGGGFGFNFQATDGTGLSSTFDMSAATITIWYTPPGSRNFTWVETYANVAGGVFTLALDDSGDLWNEDALNNPGVLTPIFTAIEPDTFAKGAEVDDREFIALSDLINGTDMPRQWNGQWLDRVSQVGPGAPPSFTATATEFDIINITQPPAVVNTGTGTPIRALLWSSGPGVKYQAGNVITIEYTLSTPANPPDPNIYVGGGVVLSGFINAPNGADPNGSYIVTSVQTTNTGNGLRNSFSVAAPTSASTYDDPPPGASYQSSLATFTLTAPAQGVQVGTQVLIAGTSVAALNAAWEILNALNAAQLDITATSLTGNVATYDYSLISGTAPVPNEQVTVTGTTNGNGIFNVVNAIITAASPTSFSIEIDSPNITAQAEDGAQAIINGTEFQFDPGPTWVGTTPSTPTDPFIFGTSTGGTIVQPGQLGAGVRLGVVMFLTRNGYLTAPSPYATFTLAEGANAIIVSNIPIGPPNVIARVIALTGANGAFYFWIPQPVTVTSNGEQVTYDATIIHDNATTSATFNITDAVLLAASSIDSPGSNNFEQIELGSCLGFISYSQRVFAWGEQNKIQNMINLSFDGGYQLQNPNTPIEPAGWTVDPVNGAGGVLQDSPLFGMSYFIDNTTGSTQAVYGMIYQSAFQDQLSTPIIQVQTDYSVRVTARSPSLATSGNLVVDLFSPTFNRVYGSFSIPLASMTDTFAIYTGTLLTTAFTVNVPPDLLYRIYAQNIPAGGSVEIDRTEPFDSSQPVLSTQLRGSYFDNFEAFDDVTGNLGVAVENQQAVTNAFELFDNIYVIKTGSFVESTDNGITEPDQWTVKEVSNKVGTPSINGVDVGEGWALIAGLPGVYIFEGGKPQKISPEIDPLWQAINWKYGYTIWIRNDTDNRRILIGVPIATPNQWMPNFEVNANPTSPNIVLTCTYKELMTGGALASEGAIRQGYTGQLKSFQLGRRWSVWSIQAAYADFIQRGDTTTPIFFCANTGNGKIYQQVTGNYLDDGEGLNDLYVTYPFLQTQEAQQIHAGLHELLATYASMLIVGEGNVDITILPDTLGTPYGDALDPIELGNPPAYGDTEFPLNDVGTRFFVQFESAEPGDWFELSRLVMTVTQNPWAPVRGSN